MKILAIISCLLFSVLTFGETIDHRVIEGELHKGGDLKISKSNLSKEEIEVLIKFKLDKKKLVPIPKSLLKGELKILLPKTFDSERGYNNLSKSKTLKIKKATLNYLGKEDKHNYKQCHKVEIVHYNNKWKGTLYYHPSVASAGWVYFKIQFLGVPIMNTYSAISLLK